MIIEECICLENVILIGYVDAPSVHGLHKMARFVIRINFITSILDVPIQQATQWVN
jgi:hypothetical protein